MEVSHVRRNLQTTTLRLQDIAIIRLRQATAVHRAIAEVHHLMIELRRTTIRVAAHTEAARMALRRTEVAEARVVDSFFLNELRGKA